MRLLQNLLTAGAAGLAAFAAIVVLSGGPNAAGATGTTATLHAAHVGATNPGFTTGTCPSSPDGTWGWHFVLPDNDTNFLSISATFLHAGTVTSFISQPTGHHAYVFTHQADTLLGATATVEGTQSRFNLSHVCTGTDETVNPPTTTIPSTTPTTPTTPTTTAPTTTRPTTTAPTTSVAPPTTASAPTMVTEKPAPPVTVLGAIEVAPSTAQPQLAFTGSNMVPFLILGVVLMTMGATFTAAARRRAVGGM